MPDPFSVQWQLGDVARIGLEFAAFDPLDDVDGTAVGARLAADPSRTTKPLRNAISSWLNAGLLASRPGSMPRR
jgi:hypothetical protein